MSPETKLCPYCHGLSAAQAVQLPRAKGSGLHRRSGEKQRLPGKIPGALYAFSLQKLKEAGA